ncbi:MAG: hypothetical protein KatS3mg119_1836 [Rhodothalassiaceae bacterium]|nr:MAG: hypothetical protein KatS3mg119_1836 [Rhodothalassiaceae bacterium]
MKGDLQRAIFFSILFIGFFLVVANIIFGLF